MFKEVLCLFLKTGTEPLCILYICDYDKRTNSGFKGQSSVAEEASLT